MWATEFRQPGFNLLYKSNLRIRAVSGCSPHDFYPISLTATTTHSVRTLQVFCFLHPFLWVLWIDSEVPLCMQNEWIVSYNILFHKYILCFSANVKAQLHSLNSEALIQLANVQTYFIYFPRDAIYNPEPALPQEKVTSHLPQTVYSKVVLKDTQWSNPALQSFSITLQNCLGQSLFFSVDLSDKDLFKKY